MRKLRILDLAWAAGFFDGEGTSYAYRRASRTRQFKLSVAQSDRRVLDRFCKAVGVGKVFGPYGPYRTQSKPFWTWQTTTTADAHMVIRQLRPFLSLVKRQQAREAAAK